MKINKYSLALLVQLIFVLFLYQIARVLFYLFNYSYFSSLTWTELGNILYGSFQFDLSAVLYLNLVLIVLYLLPLPFRDFLYRKKVFLYLFVVFNAIGIGANIIDIGYFPFTLKRTTAEIFQEFVGLKNLFSLFTQFFVDYYYLIIIWAIFTYGLYYFAKKIQITDFFVYKNHTRTQKTIYFSQEIVGFILCVGFTILGMRGHLNVHRSPTTLADAGNYIQDPVGIALVLNTPFSIIRTVQSTALKSIVYFKDSAELTKYYSPIHPAKEGRMKNPKKNVVIIVLESFSTEFIGFLNKDVPNYKGFTPFLDSLLQKGKTFQYSFANGRRSIEGIPAVVASIPSFESVYITSPYLPNQNKGLTAILKEEGYHTSFFHGAHNGSMNFDAFMKLQKVDQYFGKDQYPDPTHYDGIWGIWDHHFFSFFADKLRKMPTPFFTTIFSLSSHHPYQVPKELSEKLAQDRLAAATLPIHPTILYADYALQLFFEKAAKEAWYANTLFVITADHASAENDLKSYQNTAGYFKVPLLFYDPSNPDLNDFDRNNIAQQIDIMPSVLSYLNYQKPYFAFGNVRLSSDEQSNAINYINGIYQYFEGDYLLQWNDESQTTVGLYRFKEDLDLKNNLIHESIPEQIHLLNKLKAFIQTYNHAMIQNKMI